MRTIYLFIILVFISCNIQKQITTNMYAKENVAIAIQYQNSLDTLFSESITEALANCGISFSVDAYNSTIYSSGEFDLLYKMDKDFIAKNKNLLIDKNSLLINIYFVEKKNEKDALLTNLNLVCYLKWVNFYQQKSTEWYYLEKAETENIEYAKIGLINAMKMSLIKRLCVDLRAKNLIK